MASLSSLLLLSVGIFLILIELMFYTFFILWLGIALVIVAAIEYFYPLSSMWAQLILAGVISVVLFVLFYKPLKKFVHKAPNLPDDFIQQHGSGTIKNQMLSYQGSYFQVKECDISQLEGQTVQVLKIEKNNAWIEQ